MAGAPAEKDDPRTMVRDEGLRAPGAIKVGEERRAAAGETARDVRHRARDVRHMARRNLIQLNKDKQAAQAVTLTSHVATMSKKIPKKKFAPLKSRMDRVQTDMSLLAKKMSDRGDKMDTLRKTEEDALERGDQKAFKQAKLKRIANMQQFDKVSRRYSTLDKEQKDLVRQMAKLAKAPDVTSSVKKMERLTGVPRTGKGSWAKIKAESAAVKRARDIRRRQLAAKHPLDIPAGIVDASGKPITEWKTAAQPDPTAPAAPATTTTTTAGPLFEAVGTDPAVTVPKQPLLKELGPPKTITEIGMADPLPTWAGDVPPPAQPPPTAPPGARYTVTEGPPDVGAPQLDPGR